MPFMLNRHDGLGQQYKTREVEHQSNPTLVIIHHMKKFEAFYYNVYYN